ncbi:MAG: hypothetical protein R3F62_26200 [Planctomycetota bacterium]
MSDQRLRRLGRDARGGDLGARAELIVHRLRNGELERRLASLAAYLGDEAAAAALGQLDEPFPDPPTTVDAHREVRRWLRELGRYGQDVAVRACVILAEPCLVALDVPGERQIAQVALDAAREWLARPSDGQQLVCNRAGDLATTTAAESNPAIGPRTASYHALTACSLTAYAAGSAVGGSAADGSFGCARHATLALLAVGELAPEETPAAKVLHPVLRQRVAAGLIAWAVGS